MNDERIPSMAKRIWLFSMALALMGVFCPATTFAKPGDLPVDITQQCPDAREATAPDGFTPRDATAGDGRLAARPWAGADAAPRVRSTQPTARDAGPRPVNQVRDMIHRVGRDAHVPMMAPHDAEAARLFALGERCRQIGDYAQAAVCFEEAHLVSPTSVAGRLAIDRLRTMERERFGLRGAAEEAELPAVTQPRRPVAEPRDRSAPRRPANQPGASPERQSPPTPGGSNEFRKLKEMLDSTVPLGGAEEQGTSHDAKSGATDSRPKRKPSSCRILQPPNGAAGLVDVD
jgi:hypothetical protein